MNIPLRSKQPKVKLVALNDDTRDMNLVDLPTEFKGSSQECDDYAKSHGYTWKKSEGQLFLGYYVNKDGNCLIPT